MKYIEFGTEKNKVSNIVLGLMRIPELKNGDQVASLVQSALDQGINMLDIADCYTKGLAETLLGDAFSCDPSLRNKVFLQSKCGIVKDPFYYFDFSKEHILEAVDQSLSRLKTDHLDSLLLHRPDALIDPDEITDSCTKKVWWICQKNPRHHYLLSPSEKLLYQKRHRESCLYCKGRRRKKTYF